MHTIIRHAVGIFLTLITVFAITVNGTLSWQSLNQTAKNEVSGENTALYEVQLFKLEKQEEGSAGEIMIPGTAFLLYTAEGEQIGNQYVTDEEGRISVRLQRGEYYFEELSPADGYTFDYGDDGEPVTRYPFQIIGGETDITVIKAYNIRRCGTLVIEKNLQNADGTELTEEQKQEEFSFTVIFSDGGSYFYQIGDSTTGQLLSGESLSLKHGETAVFTNIPVGVFYRVTEAPRTGYTITSTGHQGTIMEDSVEEDGTVTVENRASFLNVYSPEAPWPVGSLTVTKTVIGEVPDTGQEFSFLAEFDDGSEPVFFTLSDGESYTFTGLPVGISYTVTEIKDLSDGYTSMVGQISGTIRESEEIILPFSNSYDENPDGKLGSLSIEKVILGEALDVEAEFTFEIMFEGEEEPQTFTLKAYETKTFSDILHGTAYTITEIDTAGYTPLYHTVSGNIAGEQTVEVAFYNCVPQEPEPEQTVKLQVKKVLEGEYPETDNSREFAFTLLLENGESESFSLKNEEVREFEVPYGIWYEILEEDYYQEGYSQSISNGTGTAVNEVTEVTAYNTYIGEIMKEPVTVDVPIIIKTVEEEEFPDTRFEFVLTGETDAPMPEGADGNKKVTAVENEGEADFGSITLQKAGSFSYTITELDAGVEGWKYDGAVYTFTVTVTEEDGQLCASTSLAKDGIPYETAVFSNNYSGPEPSTGTVTIQGRKIWNHGQNPEEERPESVIVYVYADGELAVQRQITEKDGWSYSFELQRYGEDGHEIIYSIDEETIDGYEKTVNGYDLINTYQDFVPEEPDNPVEEPEESANTAQESAKESEEVEKKTTESEADSAEEQKPKTGDSQNLWIWMGLLITSLIGVFFVIYWRRSNKHK